MSGVWEKVGYINVDAGLVWVGDPCYIMHGESQKWGTLGKIWSEFCDKFHQIMNNGVASFPARENGREGLGVCVQTAHGDGSYPVYVKRNRSGGVSRVLVKFE